MLPLPRRRLDPEVVMARLRALAGGHPDGVAEGDDQRDEAGEFPDHHIGSAGLGGEGRAESGPVVVRRVPSRPVLVGIAAAAIAAWALVHTVAGTGSSPPAVELVPGVSALASTGSSGPSATPFAGSAPSATPAALLVVHVLGDVRHPGLVRLAPGSRVADAIRAAGGLVAGGGSGALNLARVVGDGEQILVSPHAVAEPPGSTSAGGTGAAAAQVVNLNTATASDLDALPGVGPVMAARILEWRVAHGRFAAIEQLREVSGIGAVTFERLKPHVRV